MLAAGAALALATAASAQVTGTSAGQTVSVQTFDQSANCAYGQDCYETSGAAPNSSVQYGLAPIYGAYSNYQVSTITSPNYVFFADNATSTGAVSTIQATTSVQVTYKNPYPYAINNTTLTSTILPGGFGFYEADLSNQPENVNTAAQAGNFLDAIPTQYTSIVGADQFTFEILSGSKVVADYTGELTLTLSGFTCTSETVCTAPTVATPTLTVNSATSSLNNFGLIESNNPNAAVGYSWDATDISVPLGTLAAMGTSTLTYETTVTTSVDDEGASTADELVGYDGFGDPIGKKGGAGGINDPNFPLLKLGLPTFDPQTGQLSGTTFDGYTASGLPIQDIDATPSNTTPPGIPEPQTWVLLVGGIGLLGSALRRRAPRTEIDLAIVGA